MQFCTCLRLRALLNPWRAAIVGKSRNQKCKDGCIGFKNAIFATKRLSKRGTEEADKAGR